MRSLLVCALLGTPIAFGAIPPLCLDTPDPTSATCAAECAAEPATDRCLLVRRHGGAGLEVYLQALAEPGQDLLAIARARVGAQAADLVQYLDHERLVFRQYGAELLEQSAQTRLRDAHAENLRVLELFRQGKPAEALLAEQRVLAVRREVVGPDHPLTAQAETNLGFLLHALGRSVEAEPHLRLGLEIRRRRLGDTDVETASSMTNLAGLLRDRGRTDEAFGLFQAALAVFRRVVGDDHPTTAAARNNLALLHIQSGRLDAARRELDAAYTTVRRIRGERDPWTIQALGNVGGLLDDLGDYAGAIRSLREALTLALAWLPKPHPTTGNLANNLGRVLSESGELPEAAERFEQAISILQAVYGHGHPDVLSAQQSLAVVRMKAGQGVAARQVLEGALIAAVAAVGERDALVATIRNNLGALLVTLGEREAGTKLLTVSLGDREQNLGPSHPRVADTLGNLVLAAWTSGDKQRARALQPRVLAIYREHFQRNLDGADSDLGLLAFLASVRSPFDVSLSLFDEPDLVATAFADVLVWQGAATLAESLWRDARRIVAGGGQGARAAWEELRLLDRERLRLLMAPVVDADARAERDRALDRLTADGTSARRDLARWVPGLAGARLPLATSPGAVCKSLRRAKASLLDIVRYDRFDPALPNRPDTVADDRFEGRYDAFVMSPTACAVERVSLGTAQAIDLAVGSFRQAVEAAADCDGAQCAGAYADLEARSAALGALVFGPVKGKLPESGALWFVPDGRLGEVPAAVLIDPSGRFLIERFAITTLPYPAAAVASAGDPATGGAMVVGDLDYTAASERTKWSTCTASGCAPASPPVALTPRPLSGEGPEVASQDRAAGVCGYSADWTSLTPTEASSVATTLAGGSSAVVLATAEGATEARVTAGLAGRNIVHFATHGFYSSSEHCGAGPRSSMDSVGDDPLRLSAVVLSGASASRGKPPDEDGLLTARDIAALPLGGTSLVTLSACETGRGKGVVGEGVLGLARAFGVAGAGATIASLWSVPNEETTAIFEAFYPALLSGATAAEALRMAQLGLIARLREEAPETRASSALWGAFVAITARPAPRPGRDE